MAAVLAGRRKALVSTGCAISLLLNTNGRRKGSFAFVGAQLSVGRSVHWLESPEHCKLTNEWAWQRSWTSRRLMEKPLAQLSSASSAPKVKMWIIQGINSHS